jgi:Pyridoxamine 5'-phosphate oxidase
VTGGEEEDGALQRPLRSRFRTRPKLHGRHARLGLYGREVRMQQDTERFILDVLQAHNILTLATVREDGYPQATTVGYVHEGLTLYIGTFAQAQKVTNRPRKRRFSEDHAQRDFCTGLYPGVWAHGTSLHRRLKSHHCVRGSKEPYGCHAAARLGIITLPSPSFCPCGSSSIPRSAPPSHTPRAARAGCDDAYLGSPRMRCYPFIMGR